MPNKKILGLDLGTNSIGWALLNADDNGLKGIIAMNSRIIPMNADVKTAFNKGETVSKNAQRRGFRGARRLLQRYKLRRERLIKVLKILGWIPQDFIPGHTLSQRPERVAALNAELQLTETANKDYNALMPYYLRVLGLIEALEKDELAIVLYHLNQRRGFKSGRKGAEQEDKKANIEKENEEEQTVYETVVIESVENIAKENAKALYKITLANDERFAISSYDYFKQNIGKEVQLRIDKNPKFSAKGNAAPYVFSLPERKITKEFKNIRVDNIIDTGELNTQIKANKLFISFTDTDTGEVFENITTYLKNLEVGKTRSIELRTEFTKDAVKVTANRFDATDWKKKSETLNKALADTTSATYFFSKLKKDSKFRIRQNIVLRNKYKEEFYQIWENQLPQCSYLQNINTDTLETIAKILYPSNENLRKEAIKLENQTPAQKLGKIIAEEIVYYQRKLKSQKDSIAVCQFESYFDLSKGKSFHPKVSPLSSPYFQEYRIWQQINNVKYSLGTHKDETNLSEQQKLKLYQFLLRYKTVSYDKIIKEVIGSSLDKCYLTMRKQQKLQGHHTQIEIRNVFASLGYYFGGVVLPEQETVLDEIGFVFNQFWVPKDEKISTAIHQLLPKGFEDKVFKGFFICHTLKDFQAFWHLLYSTEADADDLDIQKNPLVRSLVNNYMLPLPLAEKFAGNNFGFKLEYASLSAKAIIKVLPLMRTENFASQLPIREDIKQKIEAKDFSAIRDKRTRQFLSNTTTSYFGLPTYAATALVYGSHSTEAKDENIEPYQPGDKELKPLKQHSLRNPTVEQLLNETRFLVADIIQQYGAIDEIRIELARELKNSAKERNSIYTFQTANNKHNETIAKTLAEAPFNISRPSLSDIERYKLWEESKRSCVYSGKEISPTILFDKALIDIDHIIPKSLYFDDSFNNKVVCYRSENEIKDNRTAFDYLSGKRKEELEKYENRIKDWYKENNKSKYKKLLMPKEEIPDDFVERQLKNTQYIAKEAVKAMQQFATKVYTSTGSVTDYLRYVWGVDSLLLKLNKLRFENIELRFKAANPTTDFKLVSYQKEVYIKGEKQIKNELGVVGWSKRLDNRHHALDALVIACTSQAHIQVINNLHKIAQVQGEEQFQNLQKQLGENIDTNVFEEIKNIVLYNIKNASSKRKFALPWESFVSDAEKELEKIIVSTKNKRKLVAEKKHSYWKGNQLVEQTKGHTLAALDVLHDAQPFGEIQVIEQIKVELAYKNWDSIKFAHPSQKALLEERKKIYAGDKTKLLKSLKDSPLKNSKGKTITEVSVLKRYYVKNASITSIKSIKDVEFIVDKQLGKEIENHLKAVGENDKAFADDNLETFNKHRKHPVFSVRMLDVEIQNEEGAKSQLKRNEKELKQGKIAYQNQKLHVKKGDTFSVFFFENKTDHSKRLMKSIPYYDAVLLETNNESMIALQPEGYTFLFSLSKNDLVYVLKPEETFEQVLQDNAIRENKSNLFKRLYRFITCSNDVQAYFIPNHYSQGYLLKENKLSEFNLSTPNQTMFHNEDNGEMSKIQNRCIKVKINRLGEIEGFIYGHQYPDEVIPKKKNT